MQNKTLHYFVTSLLLTMKYIYRFVDYIKSSRLELRHVNWPNRKEAIRLSLLVIGVSLAIAAFLGAVDFIMQFILNSFIL